jgi:hypothetical protein
MELTVRKYVAMGRTTIAKVNPRRVITTDVGTPVVDEDCCGGGGGEGVDPEGATIL